MKVKKSQKGFSIVEALLAIIAVSLVVLAGFYIYNSNVKNKDLSKKTTSARQTQKTSKPASYLSITELGVKIPLNDDLKNLKYAVTNDTSTVSFYTLAFREALDECHSSDPVSGSQLGLGMVTKNTGQYDSNAMPKNFYMSFAKQFSDFYITYGNVDGGIRSVCNDDNQTKIDAVQKIFDQLSPQLRKAVQNSQQL